MNKKKIVKTSKKITTNDQLSVKLIDGTIDIKVKKIN
jgi:Exonuclease VII, large subunit